MSMATEKEKMAAAETKSPSNKSNCTSPGKKGKWIILKHEKNFFTHQPLVFVFSFKNV